MIISARSNILLHFCWERKKVVTATVKTISLKFYAMHLVLYNRAIRRAFLLHFRPKRHKNDVI